MVEDEGKIKAAMLLLLRPLPLIGKNMIYSPRGPVCDLHDFETLKFLVDNVRKLEETQCNNAEN